MFSLLKKMMVFTIAIVMLLVAVSCSKQTGGKQDNTSKQLEEDEKKGKIIKTSLTLNEKEYEIIELIIEEGLLILATRNEEGVYSIVDSGYPYASFQLGKAYMVKNGAGSLRLLLSAMVDNLVEPSLSLEKSSKLYSEAMKSGDYGFGAHHKKTYTTDFERLKYLCNDQCFYFMVSKNDGSMEFNQNNFDEFKSNFTKNFVLALKYREEKNENKRLKKLEQERQVKKEQELAKQGIYKVPNVTGILMYPFMGVFDERSKTATQILQDKGFTNIKAKLKNGERLKEIYRDENDYIHFNCQVLCEYRSVYQGLGLSYYWHIYSRCDYVKDQYPEPGSFLSKDKEIELISEYTDPEAVCKNTRVSGRHNDHEYYYKYAILDVPESKIRESVKDREITSYIDNIHVRTNKTSIIENDQQEKEYSKQAKQVEHITDCIEWEQYLLDQVIGGIINGVQLRKEDIPIYSGELDCTNGLSEQYWRIVRNAVFAKYGRPFKSEDLHKFFYISNQRLFKENPNYSDSMLTDIDKDNIAYIQEMER